MSILKYGLEEKTVTWFEFEPDDGFRYEFGICIPPTFMKNRCDDTYILVITKDKTYPFQIQEILEVKEDGYFKYFSEKLGLDEYSTKVIILCISKHLNR